MSKITFTADFDNLDEIRDYVGDIARQVGFSEKEIYSIQLAADEAASNIIEHAYAGVKDGTLDVDCSILEGGIKIVMHDRGKSFNPSSVPEPNVKADLSDRKIGGLGMYLMRKLMDEVTYESTDETGNILTMIKHMGENG